MALARWAVGIVVVFFTAGPASAAWSNFGLGGGHGPLVGSPNETIDEGTPTDEGGNDPVEEIVDSLPTDILIPPIEVVLDDGNEGPGGESLPVVQLPLAQDDVVSTGVPEPGTLMLLGLGLVWLEWRRRTYPSTKAIL